MTEQSMISFLTGLSSDTGLKAAFGETLAALPEGADAVPAVVAFAREHGHDIGEADIGGLVSAMQYASSGELDDRELESVSGGFLGALAGLAASGLSVFNGNAGGVFQASKAAGLFDPSKADFWTFGLHKYL